MKRLLFSFPENDSLTKSISLLSGISIGEVEFGNYPDGESHCRILEEVKDSEVYLICSLNQPDSKILSLIFFCETAKSLGASKVHLVSPYLCYMRQDKVFKTGEGITAKYFAALLSRYVDSLLTIDPHLHRIKNLNEVYKIPSKAVHATSLIADYIRKEIQNPILIGPDAESSQWVKEVAELSKSPFTVLEKIRRGDRDVEVSVPHLEKYKNSTPVLIDDIISTGKTLLKTIGHLKDAGMKPAICVCVHGIFTDDAYQDLINSGVEFIATANTIEHISNQIDVSQLLSENLF
ncbi:phosphoribosylpyrophosphate synthetase [Leptospira tipperaryensis]|uniref:ribose-phosphate diphosphokinase n=1 Tax=Leptospira tipperaryensis TaxID=2564040 RepID=A0A1D7V0U5_9LEPT|nr:ribose-phosphate diphosphokinase [Leptospira tipperaryensis]AOP35448.1 phosphoribosylpyrophosphate synthetase [Leptospira tipperaryensis]